MSPKKDVAWIANNGDGENAEIVFHHHFLAAKRLGSEALDIEFEDTELRRAPEFDKHAEAGHVPVQVQLDEGWFFECWGCDGRVSVDENGTGIIVDGQAVFCDTGCQKKHLREVSAVNEDFEFFKRQVTKQFPFLTAKKFEGGYPNYTHSGKAGFPGGKHGVSVRRNVRDQEVECFVVPEDVDAWNKLIKPRAGSPS